MQMTTRWLATSSLAVVTAAAGSAADPGTPARPDKDEIVRRYIEARGGLERIRAIQTVVYSGGTYSESEYTGSGDAFMAFRRPYFRVVGDPSNPATTFTEGYDGAAWEWYGGVGVVVRTVGAAAGAARRGADFEGALVGYRDKGATLVLGDPATIDGRPAYRLTLTTRDGFACEYFLDAESYLIVAERRTAKVHAFGDEVKSEARVGDYRPVAGVLFPFRFRETEIASGKVLNQMQWGKVEANRELPASWFEPPRFERTPLQHLLENLYGERTDREAVLWSYAEFRRAHPEIETAEGVEFIGYQMLKMSDTASAVALLENNAADYPERPSGAFGLGRAYQAAGDTAKARGEYERALALDPEHHRSARALADLP
jgi:Tetratricopeptide repeat